MIDADLLLSDTKKQVVALVDDLGDVPVDVTRTGYTGDLGFELWVDSSDAVTLWDALMKAGRPFGIRPAGMLALDIVRVEAGLILLEVDYTSSRHAMIPR